MDVSLTCALKRNRVGKTLEITSYDAEVFLTVYNAEGTVLLSSGQRLIKADCPTKEEAEQAQFNFIKTVLIPALSKLPKAKP